eukprot:CAMPEP_0118722738 /NCGR_PEP_ID=MMETSP0800-20121206/31594_1 /TAXON_ID=210618 ORGANISM="Striatella unipunctata, Strain CCMP2910" /NCGR_SAMPLE_ID=MMETSP0800 /ASSEMBLY_ACC=CAM_ASM_000638 /LENGTH=434 /DNA_ID=CAMNT_0006631045 /DNA_START=84 /DNA_END=1388 /DNA_ORIENTATION=+
MHQEVFDTNFFGCTTSTTTTTQQQQQHQQQQYRRQDLIVVGDSVRITQVMRNIISNAIKFTNQGGNITVETSIIQEDDLLNQQQQQQQQDAQRQQQRPRPRRLRSPSSSSLSSSPSSRRRIELLEEETESSSPCSPPRDKNKHHADNNNNKPPLRYHGQWLQIKVQDTGVGMTKAQVAKVFNDGMQFNVNELQAGQGSGLGLYIAREIVLQHKGTLQADSKGLGKGTTFIMTIPLWQEEEEEETTTTRTITRGGAASNTNHHALSRSDIEEGSGIITTYSSTVSETSEDAAIVFRPLRVLVVDDVLSNRKLLGRLLKQKGHICTQAADGQEALDVFKQQHTAAAPFESVLMDYEMPVMNGPQAAKHIRAMDASCCIVGITGNVLPDDVDYFHSCGANVVLPKPLNMQDLERVWIEHGIFSKQQQPSQRRDASGG